MNRLRSAAFNLWFYAVTVVFCLGTPVAYWRASPAGGGQGRHAIIRYAQVWSRTVLAGLRPIVGIGWTVKGLEHIPSHGPVLIAAQHQATFETLLWTTLLPDFAFVLKQELTRIPIFGGMLKAAGMIAIDRAAGAAAIRTLFRDGESASREGRQLIIFPEGTRVAPGGSAPLHPGIAGLAQRTGLPVIPILTDSGLYWPRGWLAKRAGTITVEVLPPLPTGLKREVLMETLAELYQRGPSATHHDGKPVDNSVDVGKTRLAHESNE